MTILSDDTDLLQEDPPSADAPFSSPSVSSTATERDEKGGGDGAEEKTVKHGMVALAAALTSLGAVWIVTRVFRGAVSAPAVGALGVLIGVGLTYASYRLTAVLQYAVLPVALLAGAVLATTGEVAGKSLPAAVLDAFHGGGLLQPPIPFDPGWRFLLVVLFAFVGAAATGVAVSTARPKLAVAIPAPLVLGAALLQPEGSEIVASGVAMAFVVAGLAVAFGADLASEGVSGAGFETRRLLRGVSLMAVALVALIVVAQSDFLFPATDKNQVIPPQKPPPPTPEADRELFTVKSPKSVAWRMGVLDVYKDNAFLLPSIDPGRMVKVPKTGVVAPVKAGRQTYTATFHVSDIKGQTLPAMAGASALKVKRKAEYDPRTQAFKLVETSVPRGFDYTVVAALPPTAKELAESGPVPAEMKEFLELPPAPPGVRTLLEGAPTANKFERLQYVRKALYDHVVAAGAGRADDVPPARVDQMLNGANASPFEINAAEVMLARWAGIPSRIGFGFFGGDPKGDTVSFRPKHGAAWLESYFEGYGWVPIVGTPPRARASLSKEQKKQDPNVVASDELGLSIFVPVRLQTAQLVYEVVRYYVFTYGPLVLLALLLLLMYPAGVKLLRTGKRRRWAAATGAVARVTVAYAELRDAMHDLNVGHPTATPLEFLDVAQQDDEHDELAWLVTRALWGDLRRDLRQEDVEAAEDMARSVLRRLLAAQTPLNRALALSSRASLREPWTDEVPNLWRARSRRLRLRSRVGGTLRRLRGRRRLRAAGALGLMALLLGGCGGSARASAPSTYFSRLMPPAVGAFAVHREGAIEDEFKKPGSRGLVSEGRAFTVRDGDTIQGSIQVSLFKPGVDNQDERVQKGVQKNLGAANGFRLVHVGTIHLLEHETAEQRLYLWFPPERNVMELFVMRKKFSGATQVVEDVIRFQRGMS